MNEQRGAHLLRVAGSALAAAVVLAGLLGFILVAIDWKLWWLLIVVAAVSIVWGVRHGLADFVRWLLLYRTGPRQLKELADLREQLKRTQGAEYAQGVQEGRAQLIAELTALSGTPPPIIAVEVDADSKVLLIGAYHEQHENLRGARFNLVTSATNTLKGICAISLIDRVTERTVISCVEETVPEYWEELRKRAVLDPSPPPGAHLVAAAVDQRVALLLRDTEGQKTDD